MAITQHTTITKIKVNNDKKDTAVTKYVELFVVNDQLVPSRKDTEAGVFSR